MVSTGTADKRPGRPKGSPNVERMVADQEQMPPTKCPVCGSQERESYYAVHRIDGSGVNARGTAYCGVELRPTKCTACGQARFDRRYLIATK